MQNKGLLIGVGIFIAVLLVGGYYLMGNKAKNPYTSPTGQTAIQSSPSPEAAGKAREIAVGATEYKFSPKAISVTKGEKITIVFKNNGALPHNFTISDLGVATKTIESGETDTVTFVADKAGTFTYICSVPGHSNLGLQGSLEVK